MSRLILQHWDGPHSDFEQASWDSIGAYAKRCSAQHLILRGPKVGPVKSPQLHKLHLFSHIFDDWDTVVMLDSDMFARRTSPNIFDTWGIGIMGPLQEGIRARVRERQPLLFRGTPRWDFYGGAVYKFDRETRQRFRVHLAGWLIRAFDAYEFGADEGVVHYLATKTKTEGRALPEGERWACSSFDPDVAKAHLIHVRRRITPGKEDRQPKEDALASLIKRGILQ
jgi:hypothetical protein